MEVRELLLKLLGLLKRERELLINFPSGEPEEFLSLQEEKRELLAELSKFEPSDFKQHLELVSEVKEVQSRVRVLLISNLNFIEGLFSELFQRETYGGKGDSSFFRGSA
ncbi:hypothetical protein [Thermovibrio sp.]